MTIDQFGRLMDYLMKNHLELYTRYTNNFALVDDTLSVFQPAKVPDETHKELLEIIKQWKKENNAD